MMKVQFSILVVCLNAGEKLNKTLESIYRQSFTDYEILIKDGGSSDGSIEALAKNEKLRVVVQKDKGIYDAMNQAVREAKGEYVLFLNCGDTFFDENVLKNTAAFMQKHQNAEIYYGDTFCEKGGATEYAAKKITDFVCFRNIPCHQACFYKKELFFEHPYILKYRIRADYEHFLWCHFEKKAKILYTQNVVARYEGGGYSESKENRKRDKKEHSAVTKKYIKPGQLILYRAYLWLTLAPLRRALNASPRFSALYQKIKAVFVR